MYNLLIVDDEPNIVEGLYQLFEETNKTKYNFNIFKSYSAYEAIDILNSHKVDVVLLDISMPGITGLELAEDIKKKWPFCRIIFLTGYSSFDYAYRAMQCGKVKYLLKTEKEDTIIASVVEAIEESEQELNDRMLLSNYQEQMQRSLPVLQCKIISDILNGENIPYPMLKDLFEEYAIELDISLPVYTIIGKIDKYDYPYSDKARIEHSIQSIAKEMIDYKMKGLFLFLDKDLFVVLLQSRYTNKEIGFSGNEIRFIKDIIESLQQFCYRYLDISLSFIIAVESCYISEVKKKYDKMRFTIEGRIGEDKQMILLYSEKEPIGKDESFFFADITREIDNCLSSLIILENHIIKNDVQSAKCVMNEILNSIFPLIRDNETVKYMAHLQLITFFTSLMCRLGIGDYLNEDTMKNHVFNVFKNYNWDDARKYYLDLIQEICELSDKNREKINNQIIIKLQTYIKENLSGDLSLIKLSDVVYLNPNYLSRFFKQQTGITLSDYIKMEKIRHSRDLLRDRQFKINEVAREVGYDNASYFAKFFRESTGMTPSEYRNMIL